MRGFSKHRAPTRPALTLSRVQAREQCLLASSLPPDIWHSTRTWQQGSDGSINFEFAIFFLFPSYVINSSSRTRSGLRRIGFMRGWISTRAAFPRRKKWPARTPTRLPGCLSNTPRWAWVSSQDLLSSLSHGDYSTV